MHVQPLGVGRAFGPGHDVGGAEQRRVGSNAGQWAASAPIGHQRLTEHILADALNYGSRLCAPWRVTTSTRPLEVLL